MDCFQNIDETIVIIPSIMNDYEMYVLNNEMLQMIYSLIIMIMQ